MYYGGSRKDAGQAIGRAGDEGIDGVITDGAGGVENAMLESMFAPVQDWGLVILRLGLGIIFPFHGWLKLSLPSLLAWVVILLETVGAALLILGLGTRIVALGLVIDMLVAIRLVKRNMAKARFMEPNGTGWEFEFALMVAALALVLTGAGSIALDRVVGL